MEEIVESLALAWRTNQRANVRLIDSISEEGLRCTLSKRGGRSVARQFGHLHYVRVYHLMRRAKSLAEGAELYRDGEEPDRGDLLARLEDSTERIERYIRMVANGEKGAKTFKRGLVQHVAYFISHESHHRGNVMLTLKQSGYPVDKAVRYNIWDWDRL